MITRRAEDGATSPLEIFGIGPEEERAYRALLDIGAATAEEFARKMGLPLRKAQRLLDSIAARGLTTHSPERVRRYIPAAPDIAIEALAHQHQRAVQSARGMIAELQQRAAAGRKNSAEQPIELISTTDVGRLVYQQLYRSAQNEILGLVRPPVLFSVLSTPPDSSAQQDLQARGIRHRSISDAEMLSIAGFPERLRADTEAGEEARLMASVPFKMVLVDRRIALLTPTDATGPSLVIRYPPMLEALHTLFEILWERAAPLSFSEAGAVETGTAGSRITKEDEELAWLMAVGLNDKMIAHNLKISLRTLARRITDLMQRLDARTRFQAGWTAALYLSTSNSARKPQLKVKSRSSR